MTPHYSKSGAVDATLATVAMRIRHGEPFMLNAVRQDISRA